MAKIKKDNRILVWNKYNKRCAYCGHKLEYDKMQVDHITPLFRGTTQKELDWYGRVKGVNHLDNYNPSCASCNSSKSTFTIEQWRFEINQKQERLLRDSSTFRLLKRFNLVKLNKNKVVFYFEKEVKNG